MLAIVWAVYLIPKALKQGDEVARTRSIDRFSTDTRVVARREPVSTRDARLVVNPARPAPAQPVEPRLSATVRPGVSVRRSEVRRTASGVAARRRRIILGVLLLLTVVVAAVAYLGHLRWWSVAVPGGLTVAYLVLCRTLVRKARVRVPKAPGVRPAPVEDVAEPNVPMQRTRSVDEGAPRVGAGDVVTTGVTSDSPQEEDRDAWATSDPGTGLGRARAAEPAASGAPAASVGPAAGDSMLWDPVPVTLPTYVTKAKATRTVRTIDLQEPGAWTSGRTVEDAELAARATQTAPPEGGTTTSGQRAVGT